MTTDNIQYTPASTGSPYSAFIKSACRKVIVTGVIAACAITAAFAASDDALAVEFELPFSPATVMQPRALTFSAEAEDYTEEKYTVVTPFDTVEVEVEYLFIGETLLITHGVDGTREITERVTYSDGVEVSRIAVQSSIAVAAIDEVIAVGINPAPITTSHGVYFWPADGRVTSYFGRRSVRVGSRNHQGIDIVGKKGDPIYAADGGVVIAANSKMKGYGKLIIIQHDNGDLTYYAHNSEYLVEEGDLVYRGQQIAKMGSTGVSSGVHCHFEIRLDGTPVDPMDHLPER